MAWFQRKKKGILTERSEQNEMPEGQWAKCPSCSEIVNRRELLDHALVCPKCGHHHRMSSQRYFELLFDDGRYELHDTHLRPQDALAFHDRKPYGQRLGDAQRKTGLNDAARGASGTLGGHALHIAALDFGFIGGSMGSVVGEIVARAVRRAYTEGTPLVVISQSGGARMMEGALSLMQMAKTSAHLTRLHEQGLPFISVLTNPTTGGVTASFAMLGDFHLAEPGALIGFAGPRVIRETIGQDLPPGFQSAEFLQEQGFVDRIVDRRHLRKEIAHILDLVRAGA
ncbi:MAG: acetyl-CoA carboxylase, carboxyltransferase subunit beta [Rhodothermales bacterium]|nr:acetyl-CoA carboxylase, carboxyltransferase subunit beta [Rhodothermales bacterium]